MTKFNATIRLITLSLFSTFVGYYASLQNGMMDSSSFLVQAYAATVFEEGKKLAYRNSYLQAAKRFEESYEIFPAELTALYVAHCYELLFSNPQYLELGGTLENDCMVL